MIKLERMQVLGWEPAIRGMRNAMNSWDKIDSFYCQDMPDCVDCPLYEDVETCEKYTSQELLRKQDTYVIGPNDHALMMKLAAGGPVHAKYRRMIVVYVDITAPLYWWKEFDTYKVGMVALSCSTMHKIHAKEFTLDDFSTEQLYSNERDVLKEVIENLNGCRELFLKGKRKDDWWQMIQLLPSSYNQKRTIQMNYEVLAGIYPARKDHKLDEWCRFCRWIEELPYSEIIIGGKKNGNDVI